MHVQPHIVCINMLQILNSRNFSARRNGQRLDLKGDVCLTLIWHRKLKRMRNSAPARKRRQRDRQTADREMRERLLQEAQARGVEENVKQDDDENDDGELPQHLLDFIGKRPG